MEATELKIGDKVLDMNNVEVEIYKLEKGYFSDKQQVFVEGTEEPIHTSERTWNFEINGKPFFEFRFPIVELKIDPKNCVVFERGDEPTECSQIT